MREIFPFFSKLGIHTLWVIYLFSLYFPSEPFKETVCRRKKEDGSDGEMGSFELPKTFASLTDSKENTTEKKYRKIQISKQMKHFFLGKKVSLSASVAVSS